MTRVKNNLMELKVKKRVIEEIVDGLKWYCSTLDQSWEYGINFRTKLIEKFNKLLTSSSNKNIFLTGQELCTTVADIEFYIKTKNNKTKLPMRELLTCKNNVDTNKEIDKIVAKIITF